MSDDGLDPDLAALEEIQNHVNASNGAGSAVEAEAPRRRRLLKRRGRDKGERVSRPVEARTPTPEDGDRARSQISSPEELPHSVPPSTDYEGSKDALIIWPIVLEKHIEAGFSPDQIGIHVQREPIGPMELKSVRGQTIALIPLVGSQVCGNEVESPAEALYRTIVNDYHLDYTGPAIYKLTFKYRFGKSGNIPGAPANAELKLDHPNIIRKQLETMARRQEAEALASGRVGAGGYSRLGMFGGVGGAGAPPQALNPPLAAPSLEDQRLLRELLIKNGYNEAMLEVLKEAKAAPAPAPAYDPRLPPPGLSREEWERVQEDRQSRGVGKAVVQALTAMGFTPQALQTIQSPPVAVQAPSPPAQPPMISALDALRGAVTLFKELGSFQKEVQSIIPTVAGEGVAPEKEEEDPSVMKPVGGGLVKHSGTEVPVMSRPKLEDESWMEYLVQLGVNNMPALEKFMAKLDPSVVGRILEKVMEKKASAPSAPPAPQMGGKKDGGGESSGGAAPPANPFGWAPS